MSVSEGRRRPATWIVIAEITVVAVCMVIVSGGRVGSAEQSVFRAINGLPDALHAPMWVFQIFGSLAFVVVAALVAIVVRRFRLALALAVSIPLKLALEWWVVKALVERERPAYTVADAVIRDSSASPLGFPSGHAIFAFAAAGLLAPHFGRRGTIVVYVLALLSGVGRVYLGAHNPLDVVAGAALGLALAAALGAPPAPRPA